MKTSRTAAATRIYKKRTACKIFRISDGGTRMNHERLKEDKPLSLIPNCLDPISVFDFIVSRLNRNMSYSS